MDNQIHNFARAVRYADYVSYMIVLIIVILIITIIDAVYRQDWTVTNIPLTIISILTSIVTVLWSYSIMITGQGVPDISNTTNVTNNLVLKNDIQVIKDYNIMNTMNTTQ